MTLGSLFSLMILTSCSTNYAHNMFELYKQKPDRSVSNDADVIPLGQYEVCDVACFHDKHEDAGGQISIPFYFYAGPYDFRKPCALTQIYVYNRTTEELEVLDTAYEKSWIGDDDLLQIIYEFDQASEKISNHPNWHRRSDDFDWNLERFRNKK